MSIFSENKDAIISLIENTSPGFLRFPLKRLHTLLNGYMFGDVIVVGGRKTGGRSSFVLSNYVISPLIQKTSKGNVKNNLKVIYFNNRHSTKYVLERMAVNYVSQKAGGNKLSIPTIYGMEGTNVKLSPDKSKNIVSQVFDFFHKQTMNGTLSVVTGKRSISELEMYIERVMEGYGEFDDHGEFSFTNDDDDNNIIVVIDDISGFTSGTNGGKMESAHHSMAIIRTMAKKFGILIVATVPVSGYYQGMYKSMADELAPYHLYADRSIVMHNPLETDSPKFMGYSTADWINAKTGICYIRSAFVASNSMGASSVYVPLFMYPENGAFKELPKPDNLDDLYKYQDLVTS